MVFLMKMRKSAEKQTGLSAQQIQDFSPEQMRSYLEKRCNKKLRFISAFPVIGRGNILRDNLASSENINSEIDRILK